LLIGKLKKTWYITCKSGRTIFVHRKEQSLPVASNYGIQGSAGDVMYAALERVRALYSEHLTASYLMCTVHDEILTESPEYEAEEASLALVEGMKTGWLDIFPGTNTDRLVDFKIGNTWADKP